MHLLYVFLAANHLQWLYIGLNSHVSFRQYACQMLSWEIWLAILLYYHHGTATVQSGFLHLHNIPKFRSFHLRRTGKLSLSKDAGFYRCLLFNHFYNLGQEGSVLHLWHLADVFVQSYFQYFTQVPYKVLTSTSGAVWGILPKYTSTCRPGHSRPVFSCVGRITLN